MEGPLAETTPARAMSALRVREQEAGESVIGRGSA